MCKLRLKIKTEKFFQYKKESVEVANQLEY